jgi:hypothetical protein
MTGDKGDLGLPGLPVNYFTFNYFDEINFA